MKLALFDSDGTITNKDTFLDFIVYSNNRYTVPLLFVIFM